MLTKDNLKKTIDSLPINFTLDEVLEEIILLDKIEQGIKDLNS